MAKRNKNVPKPEAKEVVASEETVDVVKEAVEEKSPLDEVEVPAEDTAQPLTPMDTQDNLLTEETEEEPSDDEEPIDDEEPPGDEEPTTEKIPVVEEKAEVKEETPSKDLGKLTVRDIVSSVAITRPDKINMLASSDNLAYSSLVTKLVAYNNMMTGSGIIGSVGADRNYDLYVALKKVVNQQEYTVFKTMMDVINLVFTEYKTGAFNEVMLQRFDVYWKNDEQSLKTYNVLVSLISRLVDKSTRAKELETINIEYSFKDSEITPTGVENLKNYYMR